MMEFKKKNHVHEWEEIKYFDVDGIGMTAKADQCKDEECGVYRMRVIVLRPTRRRCASRSIEMRKDDSVHMEFVQ